MIKSNLMPKYHKHQLLKECHTCLTRVLEARVLVRGAIPTKRETKNQIWHENKFIGTQTAVWKLHMVVCMLWMSKTVAWKSTGPCGNPTRPCRCSILSIHLAGNSHIHLDLYPRQECYARITSVHEKCYKLPKNSRKSCSSIFT